MLLAGALPMASCGQNDSPQHSSSSANSSRSTSSSSSQNTSKTTTVSPNNGTVDLALAPGSLPLEKFWEIMNAPASIHESELEAQEETLASELRKLTDEELIAFKVTYEQFMAEAFTWDLWAAVYLASGGCSDDGFIYFRNWLIGRGKHAFYNAITDPDSLSIFDLDGEFDSTTFCEWDVLPSIIWDERHSSGPDFYDQLPDPLGGSTEPKGEPFDQEDFAGLCTKYPKLASIYAS